MAEYAKATVHPIKPGVYPDLPESDYRALDAISDSDLRGWAYQAKPTGRPLVIGSAFHQTVLEPHLAAENFCTAPEDYDLRTNEGKEALQAVTDKNGRTAIMPKEKAVIASMVRALKADPTARKIIKAEGDAEVAVVAELCGVMCKARIDKVVRGKKTFIIDLKSTGYDSREAFKDAIWKFGYAAAGAFYADIYAAATGEWVPFLFVCSSKRVESAWVERLSPEQYAAGKAWYEAILRLYSRFGRTDAK